MRRRREVRAERKRGPICLGTNRASLLDQRHPSPRHGKAVGICGEAVARGFCDQAGGEAGVLLLDQIGKAADPIGNDGAGGFEMELGGVACADDFVGLDGGGFVGGKVDGVGWQGEMVGVPFEDREIGGQVAQHRIGAALIGEFDLTPAELGIAAEGVFSARAAGHRLRAQADTEGGFAAERGIIEQSGEVGQVGVAVIGKRGLFAAKSDQRIEAVGVWQFAVEPWFVEVDHGGGFVQSDADLAVMGDGGVFDDGDAHGFPRFCRTMPKRDFSRKRCFGLANPGKR